MKKVLINAEDILTLIDVTDMKIPIEHYHKKNSAALSLSDIDAFKEGLSYYRNALLKWFDAQPDVCEITTEKINYSALKRAVRSMQEAVSKMETTGGER